MKLAIIPARGGSKRIPRKNIKHFHGLPIIAYSIRAAIDSACFDKVIVSTDDSEIAEVAKSFGAEVPFTRPNSISDDYATTSDVICHAIEWFKDRDLDVGDVCCIYATAPFITKNDLVAGYNKLKSEPSRQYVFAATSFPFPVQRALKINSNDQVEMFSPENELVRSQDLEESFHDAGQFYWGKAQAFMGKKAIFANHSSAILLPRMRVQDIDTPEDWIFAEALYSLLNKS